MTSLSTPESGDTSTGVLAGHTVGRIGFGAMQLPGPGVMGPPRDRDEALAVLHRVIGAGVRHIDTGQYYGPDVANELIHTALHPYPEDLVLVSKVGGKRDDRGRWLDASTPPELRSGVEDNLRSLELEQVPVVNLRLMDAAAGGPGGAARPGFEAQLAEMVALRDEGKIGAIGVSNVTVEDLVFALSVTEIACVQNPYSVADRSGDPLLSICEERGVAFVPFFPLGSAFAGANSLLHDQTVGAVASRLGVKPAQVALAWLLQRSTAILLIPGTSSLAHLEDNLGAAGVALDAEALESLDTLG